MPSWFLILVLVLIFVIGLVVVVQLFIMTVLLLLLKRLAAEMREKLDPVVEKVNTLMTAATSTMQTVQTKTEHIADQAAQASETITGRAERTSSVVQQVITAPLIGGASLASGIARGISTWYALRQQRKQERTGEG